MDEPGTNQCSHIPDPGHRPGGLCVLVEYGLGGAGTVADAELGCSLLLEGQVEACPLASCLSNLLSLHLGCCRLARPPFSSASAS